MLIFEYEKLFNSPDSEMAVDTLSQRYQDKNSIPHKRCNYTVNLLFGNVLELGAGDGLMIDLMLPKCDIINIVCLEIQDKALSILHRKFDDSFRVSVIKGIAEKLPFKDNTFECVHCGATLEHVINPDLVIQEIVRVAKIRVVLCVPINSPLSREHVRQYKTTDEFLNFTKKYLPLTEYRVFENKDAKVIVTIHDL